MIFDARFTGPILPALTEAAHRITPQARPFSTSNQAALEAFAAGNYQQAVTLDPGFGSAWVSFVEQLAPQNKQSALDAAQQALMRNPPLASPLHRAQLEALAAQLRDDSQASSAALEKLAGLVQYDARLWRTAAEASMLARSFPRAVHAYQQTLQINPADSSVLNMLGYAQAFSGDLGHARATLAEYGKAPNQATNALDSLGEVNFLAGQFADAEKAFLAAYQKDPRFLAGADLAKAAYARYLSGNRDSADQLMRDFLIARVKQKDQTTPWREAAWLYSTGRTAEAQATLEKTLSNGDLPPPVRDLCQKQLAVWKNPPNLRDIAPLKTLYDHTPPAQDGLARTFLAVALLEAGRKDEARALAAYWPLPEASGDPQFQCFLFPKFLELRKALGL